MKKILALILAIVITVCFAGCNVDVIDTNYTYDKAIIALPNGKAIEVDVKQWRDYEDGEQIQITAKDGTVYLTSSFNCILINK